MRRGFRQLGVALDANGRFQGIRGAASRANQRPDHVGPRDRTDGGGEFDRRDLGDHRVADRGLLLFQLAQLLVEHVFNYKTTVSILVNLVCGVYFLALIVRKRGAA